MYQSMFLLGVIMFGVFSVSFTNYTNNAETLSIDNNLEAVIQKVGLLVLDLIDTGEGMITYSNSFTISIPISLDSNFQGKGFIIKIKLNTANNAKLVSYFDNKEVSSFELGYENTTQIIFDGHNQLVTDRTDQNIVFQWNGITETVLFN